MAISEKLMAAQLVKNLPAPWGIRMYYSVDKRPTIGHCREATEPICTLFAYNQV